MNTYTFEELLLVVVRAGIYTSFVFGGNLNLGRVFASQSFGVETLLQGFVPELLFLSFLQFFQLEGERVREIGVMTLFGMG